MSTEAQPWGKGQSWKEYFAQMIASTLDQYAKPTSIRKITLWGGEFLILSKLLTKQFALE